MEKFEPEEMKAYFLSKMEQIPKCRSRLVKILGFYFFKVMSDQEWSQKKHEVVV